MFEPKERKLNAETVLCPAPEPEPQHCNMDSGVSESAVERILRMRSAEKDLNEALRIP